eukprot:326050-Rhodomonas_salina.1
MVLSSRVRWYWDGGTLVLRREYIGTRSSRTAERSSKRLSASALLSGARVRLHPNPWTLDPRP